LKSSNTSTWANKDFGIIVKKFDNFLYFIKEKKFLDRALMKQNLNDTIKAVESFLDHLFSDA